MDSNSLVNTQLGKYQIQAEIGRGGMGAVYRGYDPGLKRYVAVKVLPPHLMWRKESVERFLREARAAARLQHPNIVTIHNVGQEGGWYYFVMEYLEGQPLTDIIQQRGPLPCDEALGILRPLAEALDFAHHRGFVHRDIKPANIIVNPNGVAKLTDFGIARAGQESRLTATGTVMGTPEYMSPEQAKGREVDARSDQYSLAVVAYEMLCGCVPFLADTTLALLHKVVYEPPPPIHQARPDLPLGVDAVLARALAKEPGQRYPTVTALVDALERALAGAAPERTAAQPRAAVPPVPAATRRGRPPATPPPEPVRGQRRLLIGLGALAGLAALVLMVSVVLIVSGGSQPAANASAEQTALAASTTPTILSAVTGGQSSRPTNTASGAANAADESAIGADNVALLSTSTPVPSPSASPTLVIEATPTSTATPMATATPTDTPVPSPTPCTIAVHSAFSSAWNANADRLGCPTAAAKSGVWMAEEDFKRGLMIWRQDTAKIYVLYNDGRWERYDDIWQEGDPEFTCGMPSSPPTPKRGFGKIWCTYTNVQQDLGAATTAEEGDYGLVQSFYGGSALRTGGGWVYVLLDDGTWR